MTNRESWNNYQNEYRKYHYKQLSAMLEPSLVDEFKAQLKKDHISFSTFLRNAIRLYMGEEKIDKK